MKKNEGFPGPHFHDSAAKKNSEAAKKFFEPAIFYDLGAIFWRKSTKKTASQLLFYSSIQRYHILVLKANRGFNKWRKRHGKAAHFPPFVNKRERNREQNEGRERLML